MLLLAQIGTGWRHLIRKEWLALAPGRNRDGAQAYLDDPLPVLPGVVVLCVLTENVCDELQLLRGVAEPLHHHASVMPATTGWKRHIDVWGRWSYFIKTVGNRVYDMKLLGRHVAQEVERVGL